MASHTPTIPTNPQGRGWRKPVPEFIPSPPVTASFPASSAGRKSSLGGSGEVDEVPPLPEDWRHVLDDAFKRFRSTESVVQASGSPESSEPTRELASTPITAGFASVKAEGPRPNSSRSHLSRKSSLQPTYRPPTPPLPSAHRPKSFAPLGGVEPHSPLRSPYWMIYPDPSSVYMKDSSQALHRMPSTVASAQSHAASSVTARPSVGSLASDHRTAVASTVDTSSWYLPAPWQAEWDRAIDLELQKPKDPNRPEGLPMHFIPASKLKKNRSRSCSVMLWDAMAGVGRTVSSVFRRTTA